MRILFLFVLCFSYMSAIANNIGENELFIEQIDLPESLLGDILSLSDEIKHTWPDAKYYRETIDFGKVFPALEEGRVIERPIPPFVSEIRDRLFEVFQSRMHEGDRAEDYDNCIITIYQSGDGIAPHIDRNLEWANKREERKYYFDESIIGLVIEPDSLQSLYFENPKVGEASRFYLDEKRGTAFLFQGPLRNEWKHGLLPIAHRRVSMTFRKVKPKS